MQSIFITYYVTLYRTAYHLNPKWFYFGEILFLFWNSLNDPLFSHLVKGWTVHQRLPALNAAGALWTLSFAAFFLLPVNLGAELSGGSFVS